MRQESVQHKKLSLEHSWHTGENRGRNEYADKCIWFIIVQIPPGQRSRVAEKVPACVQVTENYQRRN